MYFSLFETYTESSLSTNHTDHTCIMMIDINIRQNKEANFEDVFFSLITKFTLESGSY